MKEKANVQSAAPRKVKGTVLFTVVCVMMVLIVFLMGTLTLASTASKRAQTNYQKEQTEYQARAVLDAVVDVINQDTTGTGLKKDIAEGTVHSVPVTMDGDTYTVNITQMPSSFDKSVFVSESDGWKSVHVYAVSVNIGSQTTSADTVYTAYLTADLTNSGGGGGGGGGGGAFVSMGQVQNDIGTGGYITGGTYIGVSNVVKPISTMDTFKISGSGYTVIDAPMYLNGSFKPGTSAKFDVHFSGADQFMAIMGNFTPEEEFHTVFGSWDSYSGSNYEQVPAIYVGGCFDASANNTGLSIGNENIPVNLFTGSFKVTGSNMNNATGVYGDLYAFDPDGENVLRGNGAKTTLYNWTKSTITKTGSAVPEHFGNLYSAGKLEINNGDQTIQGDLRCEKDVTANSQVTVNGDAVVGGTLTINQPMTIKGNLYADTLVLNAKVTLTGGTINVNNLCGGSDIEGATIVNYAATPAGSTIETEKWYDNFSYTDDVKTPAPNGWSETINTFSYSADYHEIKRVDGAELSNTTTPVSGTVDYGYFPWENKNDKLNAAGFAKYSNPAHETTTTVISQFDINKITNKIQVGASSVATKYGTAIYPTDYEKTKMPNAVFDEPREADYRTGYLTDLSQLDASIYDGGYKVPTYTFGGSFHYHDFFEVNTSCVLTGTKEKGNIYINPTTSDTVYIILDNLKCAGSASGPVIVVNDSRVQVVLFVVGDCVTNTIITKNYLDELYSGQTPESIAGSTGISKHIDVNQLIDTTDPNQKKFLPNVLMYGAVGSSLNIADGNQSFVTAQIRAPEMEYDHRMGKGSSGITYHLPNGTSIDYDGDKTKFVGVIGQLIAKNIASESAASWGLLYVTDADKRCEYCKTHGCTACTGDSTCTCGCSGCTCCGGGGGGGGHGISYADKFNVLYYNIY